MLILKSNGPRGKDSVLVFKIINRLIKKMILNGARFTKNVQYLMKTTFFNREI